MVYGQETPSYSWDVQDESGPVPRAPFVPVLVAVLLALSGLVIGVVLTGFLTSLIGWLLGGLLAVSALCVFSVLDTRARTNPHYLTPGWVKAVTGVAIAAAVAAVLINALRISFILGRMWS